VDIKKIKVQSDPDPRIRKEIEFKIYASDLKQASFEALYDHVDVVKNRNTILLQMLNEPLATGWIELDDADI